MANEDLVDILEKGATKWNAWRRQNPTVPLELHGARFAGEDLEGADLSGADLSGSWFEFVNLTRCNLKGANLSNCVFLLWPPRLSRANMANADLRGAQLQGGLLDGVNLRGANVMGASLASACLSGADLASAVLAKSDISGARLDGASMFCANLTGANLQNAQMVRTDLRYANITDADLRGARLEACRVYGISAWNIRSTGTVQRDLVITRQAEPTITVDNLEVAQFIHLLLNNRKVRSVIDTVTSKVVLILGRFTKERKMVLDAIRDELRQRNYLPVLFDFNKPTTRNVSETVATLAHMARFIVADITDPRSIPQELQLIMPNLRSVPVQPILHVSGSPWGVFGDFSDLPQVLPVLRYEDETELMSSFSHRVIVPAERRAAEIADRRRRLERELL